MIGDIYGISSSNFGVPKYEKNNFDIKQFEAEINDILKDDIVDINFQDVDYDDMIADDVLFLPETELPESPNQTDLSLPQQNYRPLTLEGSELKNEIEK